MNANLDQNRFLRLYEIIGDQDRNIQAIIPVSRSKWLLGVKEGIFPEPVRISTRVIAWRASDIKALIERIEQGNLIDLEQPRKTES